MTPTTASPTGTPERRAEIVRVLRTWLGTPYHHQASVKGVGTDCLGLVRGLYRELYGIEPEMPPPYSRDWAEASGLETMLMAAARHLRPVPISEAGAGDVLIFRLRPNTVAKHAGILATPSTMIHAMDGAAVAEVALSSWWRRRAAAAFSFPETPGDLG